MNEEEKTEDYQLKDTWVFYDHEKGNDNDYENLSRVLCECSTIGELNYIKSVLPKPSDLFYQKQKGKPYYEYENGTEREISSLSVFRKGIQPKWEDPKNKSGGEISVRKIKRPFDKEKNSILESLDYYWDLLILNCLSENFISSKYITGIRIVDSSSLEIDNPLYRIELWFSDISCKNVIQQEFRTLFNVDLSNIFFKKHS